MKMHCLIFGILCVISYAASQGPEKMLTLMPADNPWRKAIGESIVATCKINVPNEDANQVSNLRWVDPYNNTIPNGVTVTRIYSQKNMLIQNSITLTIMKLEKTDAGPYTCLAEYNSQTLSVSTYLKPYLPITLTDAPPEQFAIKGEDYKIKCEVVADPAPSVDWLRGQKQIHTDGRFVVENDGLLIKNLQESDDGPYVCRVVAIDMGEMKSQTINLEVMVRPTFDDNQTYVEATEGNPLSIQCKAHGKPTPIISWVRMSTQQNLTTGYDGILSINKVSKQDNDKFKCIAINKAGQLERIVDVSVLTKPEITAVRNSTAILKKDTEIRCFASGNPLPNITFWKESNPNVTWKPQAPGVENDVSYDVGHVKVTQEVDRTQSFSVSGILRVSQVTREDDGLYVCNATNSVGNALKKLHLEVQFPPYFDELTNVKEVVTWNQRPANLTCIAMSIPNATISWLFKNTVVDNDSNFVKIGNGPQSILQIVPRDERLYGGYRCCAKNLHGEACHEIALREAFPPRAIDDPQFIDVTATTITLKFSGPTDDGGLPVRGYTVRYKTPEQGWEQARNYTWPTVQGGIYGLDGLTAAQEYYFQFAAFNEVGLSEWTAQKHQKMLERSTPGEPKITNPLMENTDYIQSQFSNMVELYWKIPANNGEILDQYDLEYCQIKNMETRFTDDTGECETIKILNTGLSSFKLSNLEPDTFYKVELKAHNYIGYSVPSLRYIKTASTAQKDGLGVEKSGLSSAVIIYLVLAVLLALFVVVDIGCYFACNTGFFYLICSLCCGKRKKNEDKLGSLSSWRFPLPYCSNPKTEGSSSGNSTNSEADKIPLSEMTFVFEGKDLISNGHKNASENSPMISDPNKKDTTVEYDVKKGVSKTAFLGKDSAV